MTYATVMVSPILGRPNDVLLEAAVGVARKLGAGVLGVGAARPIQCVCHDYAIPANVFEQDRKQIARQCHEAEQAFHAATTGHAGRVEWRARSSLEPLADLLCSGVLFLSHAYVLGGASSSRLSRVRRKPSERLAPTRSS